MAAQPAVHIVCSDRHRNGKTLLARVLVDFILLDGRDPFVIDAGFPGGPLRNHFTGRTALVDFETTAGRMKLFDTILNSPGRDYVIDLPSGQTDNFFKAAVELGFVAEAQRHGFRVVVLFIVDQGAGSLRAAEALKARPDLTVYVRNSFIGSALAEIGGKTVIDIPDLDPEIIALTAAKQFSFRRFLLDDGQGLSADQTTRLKSFLYEVMTGLRNIGPAVTLRALRN